MLKTVPSLIVYTERELHWYIQLLLLWCSGFCALYFYQKWKRRKYKQSWILGHAKIILNLSMATINLFLKKNRSLRRLLLLLLLFVYHSCLGNHRSVSPLLRLARPTRFEKKFRRTTATFPTTFSVKRRIILNQVLINTDNCYQFYY